MRLQSSHSDKLVNPLAFRFRLADLLVVVAGMAVVLTIHVATDGIVFQLVCPRTFSGVFALMLIGLSCYFAWARSDANNGLWILILAWHFALIDTLWRVIISIVIINNDVGPARLLVAKYGLVLAGLILPALCSIPAVYFILSRLQQSIPRPNTWYAAMLLMAFVDIVVCTFSVVALLGARVTYGGIDWSIVLEH